MPQLNSILEGLLTRYTDNVISEPEYEELCTMLRQTDEKELQQYFEEELRKEIVRPMHQEKLERMLRSVLQVEEEATPVSKVVPMWRRWAVAASILLAVTVGTWLIINNSSRTTRPEPVEGLTTDVPAPDKNRAQIKLSDGTIIYLDSAVNGELAQQGNVKVVKSTDGKIAYSGSLTTDDSPLTNTLMNPRGSKVIDMTLADGSRVWLNAGSSVTYPIAFTGNERKVQITGEAYFEIAHNASKPFFVTNGDVQVKVLGTHFNVNAYEDEDAVRVTLMEGSVNVSRLTTHDSRLLKPGEQAVATLSLSKGPLTIHRSPDLEQVLAWKNGMFLFKNTSIDAIMKQVARWYDVEVVFEDRVTEQLNGSIPRDVSASNLFKILELTGKVHFTIEGKKIIVRK